MNNTLSIDSQLLDGEVAVQRPDRSQLARDRRRRSVGRTQFGDVVDEVAAKHGASAAKETPNPDEAYADWPGEFVPVRLPWPVE